MCGVTLSSRVLNSNATRALRFLRVLSFLLLLLLTKWYTDVGAILVRLLPFMLKEVADFVS